MTRLDFDTIKKGVVLDVLISNKVRKVYKHVNRPYFIDALNCSCEFRFEDVKLLKQTK